MNRREALAATSILFGGAVIGAQAFLAGCAPPSPKEEPFIGLLDPDDVTLLDEVAETILPATEGSPGAKAAKVGEFMNVVVTDCYSPEEQNIFRGGLHRLNAETLEAYGREFIALTPDERHAFLLKLEDEARHYPDTRNDDDPEVHYYTMVKQLSVWGYFSSEIGSTQALRYVSVPGRYDGCLPYTEGEKAWA
ncbi:MAG: gluconate 2-dehydrogenase subunit 3 family protein [Rhodothermales bacterium]|nr:gluconate 2-dehydrogenase subunit 3 family protein [Rhodothermales bacterium]